MIYLYMVYSYSVGWPIEKPVGYYSFHAITGTRDIIIADLDGRKIIKCYKFVMFCQSITGTCAQESLKVTTPFVFPLQLITFI